MLVHEIFITIAAAAVLFPAIYVLGGIFSPWVIEEDPEIRGLLEFALGLFGLVLSLSILGQLKGFRLDVVCGGLLLILALRFCRAKASLNWIGGVLRRVCGDASTWGEKAAGFFLAFFFMAAALLCFLPEIANDSLAYQLPVAKSFAEHASLRPFPDDFNSYTSIFLNSLFALGLLFKSVALAKLFHWLTAFMLTAAWVLRLENETGSKVFARFAGLLLFLTPAVFFEATTTYVDLAVSLFMFLAFFQFERGLLENRREPFAIAGLLFGIAAATKILILLAAVPFFVLWLRHLVKSKRWSQGLGCALWMSGGILAGSGYWFVQSALLTGNPLFPTMGSLFGTMDLGTLAHFRSMGPPKSFLGFLLLPFNMTFRPQDYDGGFPLGPLFLFLLPFSLFAGRRSEEYSSRNIFVLVFLAVWYCLFHNVRFLLPALGIYAVTGFYGLSVFLQSAESRLRRMTAVCGVLLAVLLAGAGFYHYRTQWPVLFGLQSRDSFLRQMERSYPLAVWMQTNLPAHARILNAEEIRRFYFPRKSVREGFFYWRTRYDLLKTPEAISAFLKEKGFTHLVMRKRQAGAEVHEPARYKQLREIMENAALVKPLAFVKSENIREARCEYVIGQLL